MPSSTNEERMERIMDVMCCLNLVQVCEKNNAVQLVSDKLWA